jgi:large repetitive protein
MHGSFRNRIVSCVLLLAATLVLASCGGGSDDGGNGAGGGSGSSGSGSDSGSGGSGSGSGSGGSGSGSGSGGSGAGGGSGSSGGSSSAQTFTISGTLTGLGAGSQVVIEDNGADTLTLSANGTFSFTTPVMLNGTYTVTVATQPQDATCTVQQGTGSGVTANVTNIALQCSANTFTISGTVAGLASGVQVTLDNNAADPLVLSDNGAFTFATPVAETGAYNVTVGSQPTGQSCSVINGQGSQVSADVTNITVSCSTDTFTIGGSVTGLAAGQQVTLEDKGGDSLTVTANGAFSFTTPVMLNGTYTVTVATQPQDATCTVQQGTGSGVTANVTNIALQCSANTFTISGTVSGLASGAQVTLDNNAADPLVLSDNGAFTFATPVAETGAYNVTVGSQPTGQNCSVTNGQGSQVSADVANITVSCSTDTFTIGGSVAGLSSGQQVTLQDNGGDSLTVTANGAFTFVTPVVYGGAYTVTVGTEPTGQACVIAGGSGSAIAANVSTVGITCMASTQSFTTLGSFTWKVPAGITSVSIVAIGGGGGGSGTFGPHIGLVGGAGAVVNSTLTVTPGQTLNLVVGGGGIAGTSFLVGVFGPYGSGGGGGSSNIDAGTAYQIIAGGGGGGGAAAPKSVGGFPGSVGGNGGNADGSGGSGGQSTLTAPTEPGGKGGSGGIGGAETPSGDPGLNGAAGGNGNGGAGGTGGGDGTVPSPGGAGGSSVGAGTGGSDTATYRSGGGGGGYGGGASGTIGGGGGAGGSTGPVGSTFAPAANGGGPATNGGDGSIVITLQ